MHNHDPAEAQPRIAVDGFPQVTPSGLELEDAFLQEMIDGRLRVVDAHPLAFELTYALPIVPDETRAEHEALASGAQDSPAWETPPTIVVTVLTESLSRLQT